MSWSCNPPEQLRGDANANSNDSNDYNLGNNAQQIGDYKFHAEIFHQRFCAGLHL